MAMRKCRTLFRFFHPRDSKWKTFLQIVFLVNLVALTFICIQEKYKKEALIDLALGSRSVAELVMPDNDTLLMNGLKDSSGTPKGKNPFVVIAVTSLPGNIFRRNIIRNTWANKAYENYGATVIFFSGKPTTSEEMANLIREAEEHEDLIVDDFQESYYALAIKTLRVFKYFKLHHPKSKFLVKTDDDVFVNVRNLVHYCYTRNHEFEAKYQPERDPIDDDDNNNNPKLFLTPFYFIAGVIHYDRGPHTWNSLSKWYAPAGVWGSVFRQVVATKDKVAVEKSDMDIRENIYPPYAEGNFYVVSDDAVVDILEASKKVPLYHLEDVFVTGVLATWVLGIEKENMPFISSASNVFPTLSYRWYTTFTSPEELVAFHCDNNVELITTIYHESVK